MTDKQFEKLGAEYREVRDAIGTYRAKQAKAEMAYAALVEARLRRGIFEPSPEEIAALENVHQAVADVEWCEACTVAAGEVFTGETFEKLAAHDRAKQMERIAAFWQLFTKGSD